MFKGKKLEGLNAMTDWEKLVGKRVLVKGLFDLNELKILEVSPAKQYVKVQYMLTGHVKWLPVKELDADYKVLEVLEDESLPEKVKYLKKLKEAKE